MNPRSAATSRFAIGAALLGALTPFSCSLTSLDHLNSGEEQSGGSGMSGAPVQGGGGANTAGLGPSGAGTTNAGAGTSGGSGAVGGSSGGNGGDGGHGGAELGGTSGSAGAGTGGSSGMTYGVLGQSCDGGLTCAGDVSCCTRIEVPAGTFQMGTNSDPDRLPHEEPPHTTNLSAFHLDQFEVTVGRFRRFADEFDGTLPTLGQGAHPEIEDSGWQASFIGNMPTSRGALLGELDCDLTYQTWTEQAGVREAMPISCVSWYVAFAFCIWDGGRLPTEAEWEMVAAGGSEERLYPWGDTTPDASTHAAMGCLGDGQAGCSSADILAVGSLSDGAGRFGHLDLAGNVWEWTLDYYDDTYYQSVGTCDDCASLSGSTPRVQRGGNFNSPATQLRATFRASKPPNTVNAFTGIRCAY